METTIQWDREHAETRVTPDHHKHVCGLCNAAWWHDESCRGSPNAHHCPRDGCDGASFFRVEP